MSNEYLTEEEQIDAIKRWWKENGKSIVLGLVLGIGGISGFRYWQGSVDEQARVASMQFDEVVAISSDKKDMFLEKVESIQKEHAGKSYADLSALVAAKKLVAEKDYQAAKKQLQWVVDNSEFDSFVHIARIRLVKVMLQLKEAAAGLELIKDIASSSFDSTYAELRGDIYALQNLNVKAKAEYQVAINKINDGDNRISSIQMKSNNLPAKDEPLASKAKE